MNLGTSKGSAWYYLLSPYMIGFLTLIIPSALMLIFMIMLFFKVISIQRNSSLLAHNHAGISAAESKQNTEAIKIVLTITIFLFIAYTPYPIVWTTRSAMGYLLPSELYNLLSGTSL